jgi:hypothetical protein
LNYLEVFCNFYKRKTEKEKSKKKEKGKNAGGTIPAHGQKQPTARQTLPPESVPSSPLAHSDSGYHASVLFFPHLKSTPVIAKPAVTPLFNSD